MYLCLSAAAVHKPFFQPLFALFKSSFSPFSELWLCVPLCGFCISLSLSSLWLHMISVHVHMYSLARPLMHGNTVSEAVLPCLSLTKQRDVPQFSNTTQVKESYQTSCLWKVLWVPVDQNEVAANQRILSITLGFCVQKIKLFLRLYLGIVSRMLFFSLLRIHCLSHFCGASALCQDALNNAWFTAECRTESCCHMS